MKKSNVVLASVAPDAAATLAEFLNFQPAGFFIFLFFCNEIPHSTK